jgi:intraflagellar transport protein 56
MLSRAKPAVAPSVPAPDPHPQNKMPELETFIANRDYLGAITMLEFKRGCGDNTLETMLWLGYSFFHLGDYRKAMETYQELLKDPKMDSLVYLYLGCCYFFLGMYKEADEAAQRGPSCKLQNRLLFHLSHKFNDEKRLMGYHQNLQDIIEDQLSLASIHYLRSHYQEAIDIYKRILLENRDFLAINVYVAMCYYKLDYYDVSQEVLSVYLQHFPDSVTGINLKACNHFKLYNGKAAEVELKQLAEKTSHNLRYAEDLIKHNTVVFRNGEGALQVFPPLLDVIPEARLNLVIHHLRKDDIVAAYNLMKDVEPSTPQEYILKGIVNAALGQEQESREHLKVAQQYFQLVGGSASECDTIPGRQCMASCFFLLKQFEDVLIYLNSIKGYFYNDDTFNYNYAQAKIATGLYEEGEELLLMIQNEKYRQEYAYLSHLCRCYIMNKKARLAWDLYLKMETSSESFGLLQLIANDCYKTEQYIYSAKAFDVLERLDPSPEYWEGKRGACVGAFKQLISGSQPKEQFREIVGLLRNSPNPQVEYIVRVMKNVSIHNIVYERKSNRNLIKVYSSFHDFFVITSCCSSSHGHSSRYFTLKSEQL